ncbi:MAG: S8 family serine peptidase, partial [Deltaproteobacteria bacterium]|nr:S8 family serine peptidase [Deltaproteobacteria bacterium]
MKQKRYPPSQKTTGLPVGLHITSVLVVVIMFFCAPISGADQAVQALRGNEQGPTQKQPRPEYVPGELLLKIKGETPRTTVDALHSAAKAQETRRIGPSGVERIKLPSDASVEEAISFYETDPNVEYAEPNYFIYFTGIPNDPDFAELWGLHNTGGSGTADADIDAPEAWDITTGSNDVIIAVTDSGVAHLHPEINPNRWVNTEELNGTGGVDDDDNGYIDDIYGWDFWGNDGNPEDLNSHGTHVAGTIAAQGNNGEGITGVNWNAKIMALRVGGMLGTIADATDAIHYAVDNGADVINASWGGGGYSQTLYNAINYANDHGVLFVASAGNDGSDNDSFPHYPSSYELDNIISVAATDQNDSLAGFSNYGFTTVDVAAPGVNIKSSIPQFAYGAP